MKPTHAYLLPILLVISLSTVSFAQDANDANGAAEATTFTTGGGSEVSIPANTDYTADNPLSPNPIIYLQPASGSNLAHATITERDKKTHFTAKKITFVMASDNFKLEGNGKIEQGKDVISGPVSIVYDSSKNVMIATGTEKNPAQFSYIRNDGKPVVSQAVEFQFFFENKDGNRVLRQLQAKGNRGTRLYGDQKSEKSGGIVPKLSNQP